MISGGYRGTRAEACYTAKKYQDNPEYTDLKGSRKRLLGQNKRKGMRPFSAKPILRKKDNKGSQKVK